MMKIKYKKQFYLSFLFTLLCYGTYLFPHYSQDVYTKAYAADPGVTLKTVLESGRFTYVFLNKVLTGITGTNIPIHIFFRIFTISMFALIIYQAYCIVISKKNLSVLQENIYFVSVCLIFLNPLFSDWFQFPECITLYIVGVFGAVYASVIMFTSKVRHSVAAGTFLLTMSVGIYQPVMIYFVLFSLIQIWDWCLNHEREKNLYLGLAAKIGAALFSYAVAGIVQVLIVKFDNQFGDTRVSGNIMDNLSVVVSTQRSLWLMENTGDRTWVYLLVFLCICLLTIYIFIVNVWKRKAVGVLAAIFTVFVSVFYLSNFVTHIFIEPWISQRTVTGFLAIVPFMVIMILGLSNDYKVDVFSIKGVYCLLTVLLCLFLYKTNRLSLDLVKTNEMDKQLSRMVVNYVEEYEKNSGIEVSQIAYCDDTSVTWAYDDIYCGYDLNVRGWTINWCVPSMIRFYTGKNFQLTEMSELVYNEKFRGKNWDYFSFEQLYIKENVLYVCVF